MNKKNKYLLVCLGVSALLAALMAGTGCSREQAPPPAPPQQSAAPAAPAPAPAPAPGTPTAAAPGAQPAGNISQIQMGMTVDQVKQIMGNPSEIKQKGAVTEYKYYTPQKVEIKFQNNQVSAIETH